MRFIFVPLGSWERGRAARGGMTRAEPHSKAGYARRGGGRSTSERCPWVALLWRLVADSAAAVGCDEQLASLLPAYRISIAGQLLIRPRSAKL
jgi:hypothetical protein